MEILKARVYPCYVGCGGTTTSSIMQFFFLNLGAGTKQLRGLFGNESLGRYRLNSIRGREPYRDSREQGHGFVV